MFRGGLLRQTHMLEEVLETRIGAKGVPVPGDREVNQWNLLGGERFFKPVEGLLIRPGVGVEASDADSGNVRMLRSPGEEIAGALHGFVIAGLLVAGLENGDSHGLPSVFDDQQ